MRQVSILRKDGKYDQIDTFSINDFPFERLNKKALKCRKKHPKYYIYDFATFDIETTSIDGDTPYGFMYHWQMCIAGIVVTGRRWEEWLYLMNRLSEIYQTTDNRRFVIYVHNLGFEFQFIRDFLQKDFQGFHVFATKSRQPLRVDTGNGFEFRCSYKLTNMSLERATLNEYGVNHIKAMGDLDYDKIRTAETPLNDMEFGYCISDVVSLYELIENRLINDHDNLESIPMTSTGYVRRECRKNTQKDPKYFHNFQKLTMTEEVYALLLHAGRGGTTHANRFLSGRIWHDVDSFDFVSDYPAQMLLRDFPVTKFTPYGEIENTKEFNYLLNNYACLFKISFFNLYLKDEIAMPYIPIAKAMEYLRNAEDSAYSLRLDNGRVLSAPYLSMVVTDIDYKVIKRQYEWDSMGIDRMYIAKYGALPKPLRDSVMEYFALKTELKAKIKACMDPAELDNLQYLYGKSKNRLNGIFGMCYTNPVHPIISIDSAGEWIEEVPDISKALEKYYQSRNNFLYYAWGIWITCWARLHLEDLIDLTGQRNTIYCDTDSSKAIGVDLSAIEDFNKKIIALAEEKGAYYDCAGKRYYMGIAEHENDKPIKDFKTLGAKKYAYTDEKGLHITISGVYKGKNIDTNEYIAVEEMQMIENFKPGFIFRRAGGSELVYNDNLGIHEIEIEGCRMTTASNVAILDSTYTLGLTAEYAELIGYNIYEDIEKNF